MPKHPIPWTENHHVQNHGPKNHRVQKVCAKIMHKTIGRSTQPNIGSKTKIFRGVAPDPIKWGYEYPSNPLLTMWKEYNTTQYIEHKTHKKNQCCSIDWTTNTKKELALFNWVNNNHSIAWTTNIQKEIRAIQLIEHLSIIWTKNTQKEIRVVQLIEQQNLNSNRSIDWTTKHEK